MSDEVRTCCMCQKSDGKVDVLKTSTPAHRHCMELATLGKLVKIIGWTEDVSRPT